MSRDIEDQNNRYSVEYGKYGAYFFDNDKQKDMTLEQVLGMLNHLARTEAMR